MRSHIHKSEFSPLDWIDPAALPDFNYGVVRKGDREILMGYLDLSSFLSNSGGVAARACSKRATLFGWLMDQWRQSTARAATGTLHAIRNTEVSS